VLGEMPSQDHMGVCGLNSDYFRKIAYGRELVVDTPCDWGFV
jgi:hypothetical protein